MVKEERSEKKMEFEDLGQKSSSALKRRAFADQQFEEKMREIQMEKMSLVKSGKARLFQRYVTRHGVQYSVSVFILLKQKKQQNKQSNKRINTVGRTQ